MMVLQERNSVKLLKFASVGSIGFAVDATVMFILSFYIAAIPARGCAFWVAASSNWWFNRRFTFKAGDSAKPLQQWWRFLAVSCIGFIPNYGCYWLLMQIVDINLFGTFLAQYSLLQLDHLIEMVWPFVAMVPGVLLGLLCNYLLAERWVFKEA